MSDLDQLLSSGSLLFRFGITISADIFPPSSRKTACTRIDSQSIRFLLIEKGSYSNPASFFSFLPAAPGDCGTDRPWQVCMAGRTATYCGRREWCDTGSLAAVPDPGDVDAKLRVRRVDPILSRSLPDLLSFIPAAKPASISPTSRSLALSW